MATLIKLTNTPSDNFFAETLLKDIGAKFGGAGTTAAGAAAVRGLVASRFGIHPQLNDGSGLSRSDFTTPRQVVTLLSSMASNIDFVSSLAVAGKTGTLQHEMNGTIAQGRCQGKTGTLNDVANLVGYCSARDGHTAGVCVPDELGVQHRRHAQARGEHGRDARQVQRLSAGPALRPAGRASPSSSSTATPSRSAFASFEPALSPATT